MLIAYPGTASLDQRFDELLALPPPRTAEELLVREEENRVYGQQVQDLLTFNQLQKAHGDKAFVRIAVADAKFKDGRSLRDMGWRPVALQLEGGSRVTLKTPYIAEKTPDSSGK